MAKDKKKGGSLAKRYQDSYESKDKGATPTGVFRWRELDQNVKFYQPTTGKARINILPYTVTSKQHPEVKKGNFEVGEPDYKMDIWTHRMVGPNDATVLCLKKTMGKPCPICEQSDALRKAGKEKEAGALKPSRRCFYNIEDVKNSPGEVMVFEVSHFLFENELIEEAKNDDDGSFVDFADANTGKEIKFRVQKITRGGFEFNEFKSFSFVERDEPLDDDLLSQVIAFDTILTIPSYEEVQAILFGANDDEDEDDEKSSKKTNKAPEKSEKKKAAAEDEDEDEEPPAKKSKPSKPSKDDDDDDEEEASPSKKSKSAKDDDDDDDEPQKPAKKAEKEEGEKPSGKCPYGHKFGKDCDQHDDCDDCEKWDKCVNASGK